MGLISTYKDLVPKAFETTWRSPSNIAFVKYWGKKGHQIPANPSLSMTLKECFTQTTLKISPSDELKVSVTLSGKVEERFSAKIKTFLETLLPELPWISKLEFSINTSNTFPHGAGIASSASGLSALCLGIAEYLHELSGEDKQSDLFFKRASFISRLASGSACRSVYGGFVTWGESVLADSTDKYATPFEVHPDLTHLQDSVLIISDEEKSVSSRAGHERMNEHAFAAARFVEAKKNFEIMTRALRSGDFDTVGVIMENEALQLHAMMMTAPNSFTLLKPNSLAAIELVREFRHETKLPLYFTLDAGPNLHLIFPEVFKNKISTFINNELKPLAVDVIHDQRGEGPSLCS